MTTKDVQYEHLNSNARSTIRREMLAMIRSQLGRGMSYEDRYNKAVRHFARHYGVKRETIERVFRDTVSVIHPVFGVIRMDEPEDRSGYGDHGYGPRMSEVGGMPPLRTNPNTI